MSPSSCSARHAARAGANFCRARWSTSCCAQDDGISIHVVSAAADEDEAKAARFASLRRPSAGWTAYAASAAAVAIAGLVATGLDVQTSIEPAALSIVFLAAVLYSALTFGLLPSIFASLLSVLVYNFFFMPPLYTFTIHDPQNVLALIAFLIVAIFTSNLAGRTREQARATRRRLKTAAALYDFSRKLAATHALDDLLWAVSHQVASALGAKVVVLMPTEGRIAIRAGYPPDDRLDDADWAAAHWAWEKGEPAGHGSNTCRTRSASISRCAPAAASSACSACRSSRARACSTRSSAALLEALLDQAAVAIERTLLDREMEESRVLAETDKLRTALLSSLSHDLRTPLTSILGAVTALRTRPAGLTELRARGPAGKHRDRGRAAEPVRRQSARHDAAGSRRAGSEARLGRSARADRVGGQSGATAARCSDDRGRNPRRHAAGARRLHADAAGAVQHPRQCREVLGWRTR